MSESIDTEAIRAYWRAWVDTPSHTERIRMEPWLARRVPALLDEIDKLRERLATAFGTVGRLVAERDSLRAENEALRRSWRRAADGAIRLDQSTVDHKEHADAAEAKLAAVRTVLDELAHDVPAKDVPEALAVAAHSRTIARRLAAALGLDQEDVTDE